MDLPTGVLALVLLSATSQAAPPPFGSSPLASLREAVFGTKKAEDAFIDRVATAAQSVFSVLNDPAVVRELRRYYIRIISNRNFRSPFGVESVSATTSPTSKISNPVTANTVLSNITERSCLSCRQRSHSKSVRVPPGVWMATPKPQMTVTVPVATSTGKPRRPHGSLRRARKSAGRLRRMMHRNVG